MKDKLWIMVKKVIRQADVVLEVVDSRNPEGTRSRIVERYVKSLGKPLIIVINKADLVPREVLDEWKNVLSREFPTIYISAQKRLGTRRLWMILKKYRRNSKLKVAVVGYPNVGKSMIINLLKGRHSVGTSPIPGFTKHTQAVRAAKWLKVIDTPGVVPLREKDEVSLVLKCSISPEELEDPVTPALGLIKIALEKNPTVFKETYGIESTDPLKIIEELAERRKLYLKGGRLNIEEAARIIIRDWQKGKLVFYFLPNEPIG